MSLPAAFLTTPLAHRGLHDAAAGRPENSRAACLAAIEQGYGIEIDVQESADDVAMVFHDADLARMTETGGLLRGQSSQSLAAVALLSGTEGIPTFAEILTLVAGKVPLLIEIKDQSGGLGPVRGGLERAAAKELSGYDGPVAVMSFNPHSVAAFADSAPHIPRGLTTCAFVAEDWAISQERAAVLAAIADFDRVGAQFISHDHLNLTNARVQDIRAAGHPVLCWTIRNPAEEAAARRSADNITFEGYTPGRA